MKIQTLSSAKWLLLLGIFLGLFFTSVAFAQLQENIIDSQDDVTSSSIIKHLSLANCQQGAADRILLIQSSSVTTEVPVSVALPDSRHFADGIPYLRFARLKPPPFTSV